MRTAFRIARIGTLLVFAFSAVIGIGFLGTFDPISRPHVWAALDPITALMAAALGLGLLLVKPARRIGAIPVILFLLAAALAAASLAELLFVAPPGMAVGSSFERIVAGSGRGGVGINTLVTGLLIACGQLLRAGAPRAALVTAAVAPALPLIAALGQLFGLESLHREMSPISVALLLPLALAGLMSFVRHPVLRSFFSDTFCGRSARAEIVAMLGLPLAIGAMVVLYDPGAAAGTATQSVLMALFAAAVVVVKTRAHTATEKLRQRSVRALEVAATTDHLTGVTNRHGATLRIEALAATGPVGVIMADLDDFKRINDLWGHAAGDRVLVDAARVFGAGRRSGDIVARWGGEEFLMILPGRDLKQTLALAQALRAELAGLHGPGGARGEITASFGVSERFVRERTVEGAMYRADEALYRAKELGRNRVAQDACAGCERIGEAAFRRGRILTDGDAMGCGCTGGQLNRFGSASTVSAPGPGSST